MKTVVELNETEIKAAITAYLGIRGYVVRTVTLRTDAIYDYAGRRSGGYVVGASAEVTQEVYP